MLINDLKDKQPCLLRLYKGESDNLFDVVIRHTDTAVNFYVKDSDTEVIDILVNLEFNMDLIVIIDEKPICFENIEVVREDNIGRFTKDVIGQYKDRRIWPRYVYTRPGIVEQHNAQIPIMINTYDICKYGIGISAKDKLKNDNLVLITFKCPELNKVLQVNAQVKHVTKVGSMWHYGCSTESKDIVELTEFLQNRGIEELNNEEK